MGGDYIEIENEKQLNEILEKNDHVIVDFYASWCGPCKVLAEEFPKIKEKHPNVKIVKVNIDEEDLESIVEAHNVTSLPHIFLYHKKTQTENFIGSSKEKLWAMAAKSN